MGVPADYVERKIRELDEVIEDLRSSQDPSPKIEAALARLTELRDGLREAEKLIAAEHRPRAGGGEPQSSTRA